MNICCVNCKGITPQMVKTPKNTFLCIRCFQILVLQHNLQNSKPEVNKPEVNKPEVNKPEVNKPQVNKPEVNKPKVFNPDIVSFTHKNGNICYAEAGKDDISFKIYCKQHDSADISCDILRFESTNKWVEFLEQNCPPFDIHPFLKKKINAFLETNKLNITEKEAKDVLKACDMHFNSFYASTALIEYDRKDIDKLNLFCKKLL